VKDEDAAAVFLKGLTVWMLIFEIRRLNPGETILVWAAAGGVGSILVPWANALGARVIGVVSTPEKAKLAKRVWLLGDDPGERRCARARERAERRQGRAGCL
jgi:NADPH2:quinone reductase